ncbi:MAG: hypothetical protein Q9227_008810 [Pyrenula ochraceoflavens]
MSNSPNLNNTDASNQIGQKQGQSASAFAASLVTSIVIFAIEAILFILIKDRFTRIYQPRTYLVPEKERTKAASAGWWKWIIPVLKTSNSEFIQKCGLDAYFFLRYLRTLLKIFVPLACVILPILLPLNAAHGRGEQFSSGSNTTTANNVTGLDQLAWGNVAPNQTNRYWAHFVLAVLLVFYVCYIFFDEMRGYIRMRQAYLTSPQHRLRASATTVLVSSIPHKWCTVEALDGLYDVFPGGLRNIWVNRNFDDLTDKIKKRNKMAESLEEAETDLIKKCWKAEEKKQEEARKKKGKKMTKEEKETEAAARDRAAVENAQGHGVTAGNPHQVRHTVEEAVNDEDSGSSSEDEENAPSNEKPKIPIPLVGSGIETLTKGLGKVTRGIRGTIKNAEKDINETVDTTNGFVVDQDNPSPSSSKQPEESGLSFQSRNDTQPQLPGQPASKPPLSSSKYDKPQPRGSPESQAPSEGEWNRAGQLGQLEDDDRHPLSQTNSQRNETLSRVETFPKVEPEKSKSKFQLFLAKIGVGGEDKEPIEYPPAYIEEHKTDNEDAVWRKYIDEKDRDTMRLPIFGWEWMISLPLLGKKVDKIYYCREELARLNLEIEDDQTHPERYPLMNSAFVQFNHQVAAHMACQSLSHHIPKQMAPRLVEIAPSDVIWDNMSIPWWSRYIRTFFVLLIVAGMVILWAIPVAFTGALSQLHSLAGQYHWLKWLLRAPSVILSILQGVLPAALLALLMFLLPLILRFLVKLQGTPSGMLVELSVQRYYFFFLFVQLFLVVSVSSAASTIIELFKGQAISVSYVSNLLAVNIPRASNYFFSYMILQALSVSAGALVQIGGLVSWFILAPMLDSTARSKFKRQTSLSEINWGTFFPVYTNLACIGFIYSIISPLIMVFNIITFTLFWFVYRYNTLYVTKFSKDTGGLLYPNALNYTFVGLYGMELITAILFFLVRQEDGTLGCRGQGIGMVVVIIGTAAYQILLNEGFSPLFRYLPITLEDDAVARDEEFARAMNKRHGIIEEEEEGENLQDALEERERAERQEDRDAEEYELQQIKAEKNKRRRRSSYQFQNPEISQMDVDTTGRDRVKGIFKQTAHLTADLTVNKLPTGPSHRKSSWADRDHNRRSTSFGQSQSRSRSRDNLSNRHSVNQSEKHQHKQQQHNRPQDHVMGALGAINNMNPLLGSESDIEAQRTARNQLSEALFAGVNDELEDLTPDQRDALVQRAFQHSALRARRPVIWIPRDDLGVSDDEVRAMGRFSQGNIWASNVRQGLNSKGKAIYSGAPPDFSEVDLIQL